MILLWLSHLCCVKNYIIRSMAQYLCKKLMYFWFFLFFCTLTFLIFSSLSQIFFIDKLKSPAFGRFRLFEKTFFSFFPTSPSCCFPPVVMLFIVLKRSQPPLRLLSLGGVKKRLASLFSPRQKPCRNLSIKKTGWICLINSFLGVLTVEAYEG